MTDADHDRFLASIETPRPEELTYGAHPVSTARSRHLAGVGQPALADAAGRSRPRSDPLLGFALMEAHQQLAVAP